MSYPGYPNDQRNPASAIPVYITEGGTGDNEITPYLLTATSSGSTPANLKFLSFTLTSGSATVAGVTMTLNSELVLPFVNGATYPSIAYTVGASSSLVITGGY